MIRKGLKVILWFCAKKIFCTQHVLLFFICLIERKTCRYLFVLTFTSEWLSCKIVLMRFVINGETKIQLSWSHTPLCKHSNKNYRELCDRCHQMRIYSRRIVLFFFQEKSLLFWINNNNNNKTVQITGKKNADTKLLNI